MTMAEAALADTPGNKNFYRFQKLLLKGGLAIVRGLFDSIHDPSNLANVLHSQQPTLQGLKDRRIIYAKEWNKLYPSNTTYGESNDFDLSLLIKLLRNICNLNPSANWDTLPIGTDLTIEADLARVKYYRNEIFGHTTDMELSDYDFNQYWQVIQDALLRIRRRYSPEDVESWRKAMEKIRTETVSAEEIKAFIKQFPEIIMNCVIEVCGYVGNAAIPVLQQFRDNIQQLLVAVQDVISPAMEIIVQNVYHGSINIQLNVKTGKALEELWQRYQSGELTSALEKVFVTDKIRELGECKMTITIAEEQYLDAQAFFDELDQHQANVEVREVTEYLELLSLDIVHGKPVVVSGNKFQAHLAEIVNKEEIDAVIQHVKKDPEGKIHNIWAYNYYDDKVGNFIYGSDDDGEFLAGRRLQILLEKMAVKNVLIMVTYWEGDVYLYLDVFKHINERALELLMSRGLVQDIPQEKVPLILEKLEKEFEAKKQIAALKAHEAVKQATEERRPTDFNIIHSKVITDRKSTFQAHLAPVTSKDQVKQVLEKLKEESKIAKATYNMLAYRIYVKEKKSYLEEGRDDGENEAGKRLLHLLETSKVENAVVIVTRWHGGIHIGTDRFKHINACASEVIRMARESGRIDGGQQEDPKVESKQKTKGKGKGKHR